MEWLPGRLFGPGGRKSVFEDAGAPGGGEQPCGHLGDAPQAERAECVRTLGGRGGVPAGIRGRRGPGRALWGVWAHFWCRGAGEGQGLGSAGPHLQPPSEATSLGPLSLGLGGHREGQLPQGPSGFKNSVHLF